MQKNKFEKLLQQKMDEFQLPPSEVVWQNIEPHIPHPRRKKRSWVLFTVLLIAFCCGGYFFWNAGKLAITGHPVTTAKNSNGVEASTAVKENTGNTDKPAAIADAQGVTALAEQLVIQEESSSKTNHQKQVAKRHRTAISSKRVAMKITLTESIASGDNTTTKQPAVTENQEPAVNPVEPTDNSLTGKSLPKPEETTTNTSNENNNEPRDTNLVAVNKNNDIPGKSETVKTTTAASRAKELENKKNKYNRWKLGVTISAGISGIPNGFLGSLDKSYSFADQLNTYPPQQNSSYPLPSKIRSSGALIAGFVIEKNVSKNKVITTGLQYKLFSVTNKVGQSPLNFGATRFTLLNPVTEYHNYFHFIELPLSLKIRLNRGKVPLFWEGGISLSRLVASNALQVASGSNYYYKDNGLFNKSQFGCSTGLSTAFFIKRKASVLVGPSFYYGTSRIASESLYKNQHFTFIGLKTQIQLN